MFKTLTARAIVPVALAVTGFVVVCCILLYSLMKADMINDAVGYETNLADTIKKTTHFAMLKSDREMLSNIIDNVGAQHGVEHVRIFNKKGLVMFSENHSEINSLVDKKTAGCIECHTGPVPSASLGVMQQARRFVNEKGVSVIAITSPIYNEPACYNAECHFHGAGQKVLGTLDIGLTAAPLLNTLSLMRSRMIVFSVMVLILTIGGVCALLRRNLFIPLKEINEFTAEINRGNLNAQLPESLGELKDMAQNVKDIADRLKHAEKELIASKADQKGMTQNTAVKADSP
jgi:HAMP domain-containing protein